MEMEMEETETESGGGSAVPECLSSFVDRGSVESHRYFLARRTLLEMLFDRGFPVPDDELALTLPAFRAKFGDTPKLDDLRISLSIPSKGSPPRKVPAYFPYPTLSPSDSYLWLSFLFFLPLLHYFSFFKKMF